MPPSRPMRRSSGVARPSVSRSVPGVATAMDGQRLLSLADYDRRRDLAPLLTLWPWELDDSSVDSRLRIVAMLRRALRIERQRGIAGHWAYDISRHERLLKAYKAEVGLCGRRELQSLTTTTECRLNRPDGCQGPSFSPIRSARPHNSEPPSGSRAAVPTFPDIPPARGCSASSDGASGT